MTLHNQTFRCYLVDKHDEKIVASIVDRDLHDLPAGEVTISVRYSAINYKDALAATGHPGVALQLPLVPGIDAVGTIFESSSADFKTGQRIIVKGADFGTRTFGGWSDCIRVPSEWCYAIPNGLDELQAVTLGTAGFTAAQCVDQLIKHGIEPDSGPIVVSGSTGGVGILAVMILAKLGYQVVASTGKEHQLSWLKEHGASDVISRSDLDDRSKRPLLSSRWAGAVDTVGGNTLSTILRQTRLSGCVTACGLVAGSELDMTVFPFILRGVTLQGIDSGNTTRQASERIWNLLANEFKTDSPQNLATIINLEQVPQAVSDVLAGNVSGRMVIALNNG